MKIFFCLILFVSCSAALAKPAGTGVALGVATGVSGIDFSDGTTRFNVGGGTARLEFGVHTDSLVFLIEGQFTDLQMIWNNYVASWGGAVRWYFLDSFYLGANANFSQFQRTSLSGIITTNTLYTGGNFGAEIGAEVLSSGSLHVNLSASAKRYDFGSYQVTQGQVTSTQDLTNHLTGLSYSLLLGFNWYL